MKRVSKKHRNGRRLGIELLEDRRLLSVASLSATTQPTKFDQYLLELVNRGRANPTDEASRYNIDLNEGLAAGTISTTPKQPLAFSPELIAAAWGHSQWMIQTNTFSHTGQGGSSPGDRMEAAGYSFVGDWPWAENIAWKGTTGTFSTIDYVDEIHRSLFVSESHRVNQMKDSFREFGTGVVSGTFRYEGTDYNSLVVTEDFAVSGNSVFLTGVVYDDGLVSANRFYTPGEGLGGVTVTATRHSDGQSFSTQTWASGGYSLPVDGGTYTLTATSGTLDATLVKNSVSIADQNVKVDFTLADNAAPIVSSVAATPSTVARPGAWTLTAQGVSDPNGQVSRVQFYRDTNGDGVWDPSDEVLGTDQSASGGWTWSGTTAGWAVGQHKVFARAQDNQNAWSQPVTTVVNVTNAPPTIANLASCTNSVFQSDVLTLTASGVQDPDGTVVSVEFYRGSTLLGSDQDGDDSWSWTGHTANWSVGQHTVSARALDNEGTWSELVSATITVQNASPLLASLSATPTVVLEGEQIELTAGGVSDPDGTVVRVEFYSNGVLLGTDTDGTHGWTWTGSTSGWPAGTHEFSARAWDNDGAFSELVTATATVVAQLPLLDFGVVPVFARTHREIVISNDGPHPLIVPSFEPELPFTLQPMDGCCEGEDWIIEPGFSVSFLAGYAPTEEGSNHALLPLNGDLMGRNLEHLGLAVTGWQNTVNPYDVNGCGAVTPADVLLLINEINYRGTSMLTLRTAEQPGPPWFLDPNGDGHLTPADVLAVINHINCNSAIEPEGEADRVFSDWDEGLVSLLSNEMSEDHVVAMGQVASDWPERHEPSPTPRAAVPGRAADGIRSAESYALTESPGRFGDRPLRAMYVAVDPFEFEAFLSDLLDLQQ